MLRSFLSWPTSKSQRRALWVSGAAHVVGIVAMGGFSFAALRPDLQPIGEPIVLQATFEAPEDILEVEFESTWSGEPIDIMPQVAYIESQRWVHTPANLVPIEELLDAELLRQVRPHDMLAVDESMQRQQTPQKDAPLIQTQEASVSPRRQQRKIQPNTPTTLAAVPQRTAPSFAGNSPAVYPDLARQRGYEGVVLVRLHIDAHGRVKYAEVAKSSGHAILDAAAITTVRRWEGLPATLAGQPIATVELLPFRFRLR
jgi:TonB family protein